MDRNEFNQFCSAFPAASHVIQWRGSDVWKVGGKVFAIGTESTTGDPAFTFKTSDLNFEFLRVSDGYIPAPYFASRGLKWIQQINGSAELNEDLKYYLSESYQIVSQGLSQRKQEQLGFINVPS